MYENEETYVPASNVTYVPTNNVRYVRTKNVHYVPTQRVQYVPTSNAVSISEPGTMIAGNRIYYISDNPRYDLSGGNEQIVLVENGSSYRAPTTYTTATFVTAVGGYAQPQVVTVPAEYHQDWLAVAAGDRPVRCIPAVATTMNTMPTASQVTYRRVAPSYTTARYSSTGTRYVTRSRPRYVTHRRHSNYTTTNGYFVQREPVQYQTVATESPCYTTTSAVVAEAAPMGDIYQIGPQWYMERDGKWARADSWRGPFMEVKKGHVPREVRESAKRKHKMEDED